MAVELGNIKTANVVILCAISTGLDLPVEAWREAIKSSVAEKFQEINLKAFMKGIKSV